MGDFQAQSVGDSLGYARGEQVDWETQLKGPLAA